MRNLYTEWPGDRLFESRGSVAVTQAKACWGCLHVGEWAFYIWTTRRRDYGWRLELFTPLHRFRWHAGAWRGGGMTTRIGLALAAAALLLALTTGGLAEAKGHKHGKHWTEVVVLDGALD